MTEILVAISAVATAGSLYSSSKAASAQTKANQAQRRQEALAAAIQRRQQQKEGRKAYAMALQAGENQGVAGSSGVEGGTGSITSQINANLSFLDQQTQIADYAGKMFDRAARWSTRAQMFSGISSLAMVGADQAAAAEQAKKFDEMFKDRKGMA